MHLRLADGNTFNLVAGSATIEDALAQLGSIMQLEVSEGPTHDLVIIPPDMLAPAHCPHINAVISWLVSRVNHSCRPKICHLPEIKNDTYPINMLAARIAQHIVKPGGMLLHGALAEGPCGGVILCGKSGVGKSTASKRLPAPWHSLSDDAVLVVCDDQGHYWAQPWPTWSRFFDGGPGDSWNVQYAVPLRGIFFLEQALDDQIVTVSPGQAANSLTSAAYHSGYLNITKRPAEIKRAVFQGIWAAVVALIETVPAYKLHISLTGAFWEEIERVLPLDHIASQHPVQIKPTAVSPPPVSQADLRPDDTIKYGVTIGSSMAPTLCEADILTIESYREQLVQSGDVVCFQLPEHENMLVQRVTRVAAESIYTRNDNSEHTVRHCLKTTQIVGRVIAAQRDQQQRRIAGGWRGRMTGYALHLRQIILRAMAGLWSRSYDMLVQTKIFCYIVPPHLKSRILVFQDYRVKQYKIMMGEHIAGYTDLHPRRLSPRTHPVKWHIQPSFRLFIDEDKLP